MSKHEYINNQYIASDLKKYCGSDLAKNTGYNVRSTKQKGDSVLFEVGSIICKISLKGMVKNNPHYYYSQLEFLVGEIDKLNELISLGTKNSLLTVKRSKTGRISGNQIKVYENYIRQVCLLAGGYNPVLDKPKLDSK